MFSSKLLLNVLTALATVILIASCSDRETVKSETQSTDPHPIVLDVYKSPICGCCNKWISHVDGNGFQSIVHSRRDTSVIKEKKGIEPRYRSCDKTISKEGYVFEEHIYLKFIQKFLKEKHIKNVIDLSVQAMTAGPPDMEVGDRFKSYKVLRLKWMDLTSSTLFFNRMRRNYNVKTKG